MSGNRLGWWWRQRRDESIFQVSKSDLLLHDRWWWCRSWAFSPRGSDFPGRQRSRFRHNEGAIALSRIYILLRKVVRKRDLLSLRNVQQEVEHEVRNRSIGKIGDIVPQAFFWVDALMQAGGCLISRRSDEGVSNGFGMPCRGASSRFRTLAIGFCLTGSGDLGLRGQ